MTQTILLTGATDGIGLETAKRLAAAGHTLLLHGRSEEKLAAAAVTVSRVPGVGTVKTFRADLSDLGQVVTLSEAVSAETQHLDVLINNAGVFKMSNPTTTDGFDARFIVNTIAPYLLIRKLLTLMGEGGRVVNLSSAAQAPVSLEALRGRQKLGDGEAYAQSKLAITMWSFELAKELSEGGPSVMAVNPASFLGSKMVKEAYGHAGHDLGIGADILVRMSTSPDFAGVSGKYFDNDQRRLADPHPDALNSTKNKNLITVMEQIIASRLAV
ncbi:MAG: SDR family NAD(P)-dependent oxidoreductase [Pseudomonadota bacterium]